MTKADISPEQEQAINLILTGATDQSIADAVGVTRQTVNTWRNQNPAFMAELNQRRAVIWAGHVERLRGMTSKALDVLQEALADPDPKEARAAAVHILKACGLYGQSLQPLGLTDAKDIEREQKTKELLQGW